jgi:hypothetical protein
MKSLRTITLVAIASVLSACGGGAHALPAAQYGTMVFRVVLPAKTPQSVGIRPMFISPNSQSVSFKLTSVNGAPQNGSPTVVALSGSNCTTSGGTQTCTASTTEPVGNDSFVITTYASTDGSGPGLSINGANVTVAAGTQNVSVTLNGIVNSLAFSPTGATCPDATQSCTAAMALNALDASGAIIVGPGGYVFPTTGAQDTITLSCDTGLTPNGNTSMTQPSQNTNSQVTYGGSGAAQGGSLSCRASDSIGNTATYTVNFSVTTGTVSWTLH